MPDHVCRVHAIEFWTGLLAFTSKRADGASEETPGTDLGLVAANDLTWGGRGAQRTAA
jgi:hypothetical protein